MSEGLINERELLLRLAGDDKHAFDALYYYYEPRLRLFLYPFTNNDEYQLNAIIQDVFVKLWLKRNDLVGIAFLEYYLQRMAKNRLLDVLKLQQIKQRHEKNYMHLQPDSSNTAFEQLQLKEYMSIARKGIAELPERRRQIYTLYVLNGLSLDEVASQLNVSKDVVKKQLQHAKTFLKEYISAKGGLPLSISSLILLATIS